MSLISCKECGERISNETRRCPKCGAETQYGKMRGEWLGVLISLVIAIGFLIWGLVWFLQNAETFFDFMKSDYKEWQWEYDEVRQGVWRFAFAVAFLVGGMIDFTLAKKRYIMLEAKERRIKEQAHLILEGKKWVCACGRMNESYTYTCVCGKNKSELKISASRGMDARDNEVDVQGKEAHPQESQQAGNTMRRFCSACGAQLTGSALFCTSCGEKQ